MPGADWIPGVSQAKSAVLFIAGDGKGAKRTQENFWRECPGFSQVTSIGQLVTGDPKGAWETQKRCLRTVDNIANATPCFGQIKCAVHYMVGDREGGDRAYDAAFQPAAILDFLLKK